MSISSSQPLAAMASRVGSEHADVVAVGAVDRPADRDAVTVDADRPLPAEFAPVSGVRAGAFAAVGGLVQRLPSMATSARSSPMIRSNAASASARELVEHAGGDPLVAAGPQRGVGDPMFEDRFDVDPRRPGRQPDQDPPEADPVRDSRVGDSRADALGGSGSSGSIAAQTASTTSGSSARMMCGDLPGRWVGSHSVSKPSQPNDRWMVTIRRLPASPSRVRRSPSKAASSEAHTIPNRRRPARSVTPNDLTRPFACGAKCRYLVGWLIGGFTGWWG